MSEKSGYWLLKNFNIFDGLDDETVAHVDKNAEMCVFRKNEPVYLPADPRKYVYFLKKGHVKISRYSEDGQELILDVVGPGEVFGELSLYDENNSGEGEIAHALDEVLICNVYRDDFEKILNKFPQLNFRLTKKLGLRIRKIEQRVEDLVFKGAKKRIISFLLHYGEQFGKIKNGVIRVSPALSHQEIGYLTGAARQTVTTLLNDMREEGLIDFNRKEIIIQDYEKLKKANSGI